MKNNEEGIKITSLGDKKRMFIKEECDTCLNRDAGADQCKICTDGRCNYIPKQDFKCADCIYSMPDRFEQAYKCSIGGFPVGCTFFKEKEPVAYEPASTPLNGYIEPIKYIQDIFMPKEFIGFCLGNVLNNASKWMKNNDIKELKSAKVYLDLAIESAEKLSNP